MQYKHHRVGAIRQMRGRMWSPGRPSTARHLAQRVQLHPTTPRTRRQTTRQPRQQRPWAVQLIWTLVCQVGMVRRAAFRSPSSFCAGVRGAGVRLDGVVSLIFEGWVPHDPGFEAGLRCLGSSVTRGLLIAVPRVPATAARPTERSRRNLLPPRVRRWLLPR